MKSLLNLLLLVVVVWVLTQLGLNGFLSEGSEQEDTEVVSEVRGGHSSASYCSWDIWDEPLSAWPKARSVWNE